MISSHPSYKYAANVVKGTIPAPKYVIAECAEFKSIADGFSKDYIINEKKVAKIDKLLKLMVMPKGLKAGQSIYSATIGYQWLFYIAVLCIVHKRDHKKRRYETAILEICRKNYKTFTIGTLFILLILTEPAFSKLFSVAPDGSLSREVKQAIEMIIKRSPLLAPEDMPEKVFKIRRDDILCKLNENDYVPLNYSNSRLDGRLPSVFLVDEAGALPNNYAIEAMRSGQLTVLNKLGCIISTKYPKTQNPFEDEVSYAKKVLDGVVEDERVFALLYEPDNKEDWMTDDVILQHGNPAALEDPTLMEDLFKKRKRAIEMESARENFVTKHCNIIYQGIGTETYIPVSDLIKCRTDSIDFKDMTAYVGVDLAMTTDNCAAVMLAEKDGHVYCAPMAFIPEGRTNEKTVMEKFNYPEAIRRGECIGCGDKIVDYGVIEDYVFDLEDKYGVNLQAIGYDRYNAMSSAQKWERGRDDTGKGYSTVVIRQHSDTLHPPTKLLHELILEGKFHYISNALYEQNFENARCTYDTNQNRYVNKKKSTGKVDLVVATINALFLLQQNELSGTADWVCQSV